MLPEIVPVVGLEYAFIINGINPSILSTTTVIIDSSAKDGYALCETLSLLP
jgi:hypothetical protein